MTPKPATLASAVAGALIFATHAAAGTPAWLQQAAATAPQMSTAPATVLLDEMSVTVGTDGKAKTVRHYAVYVHDRAGRDAAGIREVYVTGSGSVKSMRGWVLRPSAEPRELGDSNIIDAALVGNDVYNDVRVRALRASAETGDGEIFGAEVESEERLLFAQFEWALQDRWPVLVARRTLTLPERWRARAVTFNTQPIAARSDGRTTSWEMTNLPAVPDEVAMPPRSQLVPRLAVSVFSDASQAANGQFENWQDVSRWLDTISHEDAPAPASIVAKARMLTASAGTDLERIAAIADYVQHVQYVSIQTGIGRGGGYQPRPAALVLERNYGDCKDKANLMRALLAAVGLKAYLVAIYSGDREYVRAEWPSPQQFNHAIVAVAVSPDTSAPTVLDHPSLGRLLLFDPADEFTPVGELPFDEQGSLALIVSPQGTAPTRVPTTPLDGNRLERVLEGAITAEGALVARIQEQSHGARAADERAAARVLDAAAYRARRERRFTAVAPGAVLANLQTDSVRARAFTVTYGVTAPLFAQPMGSLLLVKLPLGIDQAAYGVTAARQTAIVLEPELTTDSVQLQLPAGFSLDEVPGNVSFETSFGRYSLTYTASGASVTARRVFELRNQSVDAAKQSELLAFFTRVRSADTAPLVLKK